MVVFRFLFPDGRDSLVELVSNAPFEIILICIFDLFFITIFS